MSSRPIYCAGPHVDPVQLGTVEYDQNTPAVDHAALCADCAAVYAEAVSAPDQIDDGTGKKIPNPDKVPPGQIPRALIVERVNQKKDPNWTPPPHNYKDPPGQVKP